LELVSCGPTTANRAAQRLTKRKPALARLIGEVETEFG
jgi:hypothetical protein